MTQKIVLLVVSIICGFAAMLLMNSHLRSKEAQYRKQFELVPVMVATQDIPLGTVLTEDMSFKLLGTRSDPKRTVTSDTVVPDKIGLLLGQKFQRTLYKGDVLKWSHMEGERLRGGNLASMVTETERAVSVPVDLTSSVTGHVEPNDHVDILGTFTFPSMKGDPQLDTVTMTILQNVTVLATGKETTRTMETAFRSGGGVPRASSYSTVTLLVTPKEAEMLVFALQKGRLTLSLRNPADVGSAKDLSNINFNYLEKKIGEFNDARQDRLRKGSVSP
jgi:pilus assembly protein CpaB